MCCTYLRPELLDGQLHEKVSDANQPYLWVVGHVDPNDVLELELLLLAVEELPEELCTNEEDDQHADVLTDSALLLGRDQHLQCEAEEGVELVLGSPVLGQGGHLNLCTDQHLISDEKTY